MIETIIAQLKTILNDSLPAMLDTVNDEFNDNIILPLVYEDNIIPYEKDNIDGRPFILIVASRSRETQLTNAQKSGSQDITHQIYIFCSHISTSEELLTKIIMRYIEAIKRVIRANPTIGDTCSYCAPTDTDYYITVPGKENNGEYIKSFRQEIEAMEALR
jgi:hypothetical protein